MITKKQLEEYIEDENRENLVPGMLKKKNYKSSLNEDQINEIYENYFDLREKYNLPLTEDEEARRWQDKFCYKEGDIKLNTVPDDLIDFTEDPDFWIFAKTYAETAPHEYVVRRNLSPEKILVFDKLVKFIEKHGYEGNFHSKIFKYFDIGDYKYWVMEKNPELINRALKKADKYKCDSEGFYHDSTEDDPKYREIFKRIDKEVDEAIESDTRYHFDKNDLGYCHYFWDKKKEILKKKYKIDWDSPAECNPHIIFD